MAQFYDLNEKLFEFGCIFLKITLMFSFAHHFKDAVTKMQLQRVHVHVDKSTPVRACTHAYAPTHKHTHTHLYLYRRVCVCLCVYPSKHIHVAVCGPIGTKFGTHMQIHLEKVVGKTKICPV